MAMDETLQEPSTSGQDRQEVQDRHDDYGDDSKMGSESSRSSSVSKRSRRRNMDAASTKHKPAKSATAKNSKLQKKKRRSAPTGRVRKKSLRRAPKKPKRKPRTLKTRVVRKKRERYREKCSHSLATVLVQSSDSDTLIPLRCRYCGHRCCRRRYNTTCCKRDIGNNRRRELRRMRNDLNPKGTRCVQAGSTSLMLSSLCEASNALTAADLKEPLQYCDVTPEMIYESLRRLTTWREDVNLMAILDYMRRNYPVCPDIPTLCEELVHKLQIAALVGIVTETAVGYWRLGCPLQNRKLTVNHVTLFWTAYGDTMKPVTRKTVLTPTKETADHQTTTKSAKICFEHEYI